MHRLVSLNKQTSYSSLNYLARNVACFLQCKTSISFLLLHEISHSSLIFKGQTKHKHLMLQWFTFTCHFSCTVHDCMFFCSIFFLSCIVLYSRFSGFRLSPNPLFTTLMTSKLIYAGLIYMVKNGSLIAEFLSVLTAEDTSSVPWGLTALWHLYVPLGDDMSSSLRADAQYVLVTLPALVWIVWQYHYL